ncbi:MAG: DUF3581 domain-containing protein [Cellvibrionaceae bacterium]
MFLDSYFSSQDGQISFTRKQASDFAKQLAGDYNPIHNEDAKRFCVPGDLLFSLALSRYGISQHMEFTFSGMVTDTVELAFPKATENQIAITDSKKEYLHLNRSGDNVDDPELIESLARSYVAFSGTTFPHLLVPLMRNAGVMINPDRPLVIYQKMILNFDSLDTHNVTLEDNGKTHLTANGKKGSVCLAFDFVSEGKVVGHGEKHMVLSGLRDYDEEQMQGIIDYYEKLKLDYQG